MIHRIPVNIVYIISLLPRGPFTLNAVFTAGLEDIRNALIVVVVL